MQRVAAVAGLVLVSMVGVAYADSPGGWSQFNEMMKPQAQVAVAPVQQVQQAKPVYEFAVGQKSGTWVSTANPNEGATN
jgi:hypothetical protein